MSVKVSTNVNLDALKNLDADKRYFLSSTTGEIKEASIWMRMKCAIGIKSAQQKVANLVDAVRATLLDAAGANKDERLDTDISGIKLTEFVKGSDIPTPPPEPTPGPGRFLPAPGEPGTPSP